MDIYYVIPKNGITLYKKRTAIAVLCVVCGFSPSARASLATKFALIIYLLVFARSREPLRTQAFLLTFFAPRKKTGFTLTLLYAQRNILLPRNKASSLACIFVLFPLFVSRSSREPLQTQAFLLTFFAPRKKTGFTPSFFLAQRKGFEPLYTFLHNTISNRARSTAPPSLQTAFILYIIPLKKATVFAKVS